MSGYANIHLVLCRQESIRTAFLLSQGGEFAFVLLSLANELKVHLCQCEQKWHGMECAHITFYASVGQGNTDVAYLNKTHGLLDRCAWETSILIA